MPGGETNTVCPSHRGLDIISLYFPQLAQPTQCKPQVCILEQTERPGVRRGHWQHEEDEQRQWWSGREGRNLLAYLACFDEVSECVFMHVC